MVIENPFVNTFCTRHIFSWFKLNKKHLRGIQLGGRKYIRYNKFLLATPCVRYLFFMSLLQKTNIIFAKMAETYASSASPFREQCIKCLDLEKKESKRMENLIITQRKNLKAAFFQQKQRYKHSFETSKVREGASYLCSGGALNQLDFYKSHYTRFLVRQILYQNLFLYLSTLLFSFYFSLFMLFTEEFDFKVN